MVRPRPCLDPVRDTSLEPDPTEHSPDTLVARLPALRVTLEEQRRFRREQLAHLDGSAATADSGRADDQNRAAAPALREVDDLVATGARRALADIELALLRMSTGRYGICRSCEAPLPLALLEAIPKTTLCLPCQPGSERGRDARARAAFRSRIRADRGGRPSRYQR